VSGVVTFGVPDGGWLPCTLDVHVSFQIDAGPWWVLPVEGMDAAGVPVGGGCV
jgi:hypothetical protein